MVNLEQIHLLESRVQKAITYIQRLRDENTRIREDNSSLKVALEKCEQRIGDLERVVSEFKDGQAEIERSIVSALKQLDRLEDEVVEEEAPAEEQQTQITPKPVAADSTPPLPQAATPTAEAVVSEDEEVFEAELVSVDEQNDTPQTDRQVNDQEESDSELDIF